MSKHIKIAQLWCVGMVCAVAVHAADSAGKHTGSFEGGFSHSWVPSGSKGTQFMVDSARMSKTFDVTDKVKVVMDNSFHAYSGFTGGPAAGSPAAVHNDTNYINGNLALSNNGFTLANRNLFLQCNCSDMFAFQIGHISTNFGMESLMNRYDMHSYYYSYGSQRASYGQTVNASTGYGWSSDLGFKISIMGMAGNWHLAVVDGRRTSVGNGDATPAVALNWNTEIKSDSMSIMPVASLYAGKFRGGPRDFGFTAGAMMKFGMVSANFEFQSLARNQAGSGTDAEKDMAFWFEPGFDFGFLTASVKGEWYSNKAAQATGAAGTSNSNLNLGVAVSHEYSDKYRIKLAYMHNNVSDKAGFTHGNDLRVLFSTRW